MNDEWWMPHDQWWMLNDVCWMMNDEWWWMMNDERWMKNDEWWILNRFTLQKVRSNPIPTSLCNRKHWTGTHKVISHFESITKVRLLLSTHTHTPWHIPTMPKRLNWLTSQKKRLNSSQPGCATESTELVHITKGKTSQKKRLNSSQPGCATESTELVHITKGKTELIPTRLGNRKHWIGTHHRRKDWTHPNLVV